MGGGEEIKKAITNNTQIQSKTRRKVKKKEERGGGGVENGLTRFSKQHKIKKITLLNEMTKTLKFHNEKDASTEISAYLPPQGEYLQQQYYVLLSLDQSSFSCSVVLIEVF